MSGEVLPIEANRLSGPEPPAVSIGRPYRKPTMVNGHPAEIECVDIGGQTYAITPGPVRSIRLEDEWFEDQHDPAAVIAALRQCDAIKPDIFTFWQRLPHIAPAHDYELEWEEIAALPVTSYSHWWDHQIKSRTRSLIRKTQKDGVVVAETAYDDEFVRGMTAIFNESPMRQGRRFWHYGKDFETVKRQFSRFIHRETMIGAYYKGEMIGLVMLANAGRFGITGQIIASLKHRDKAISNALIAKAVEVCEQRNLGYLVYLMWSEDSLAEFKRRCGFEKTRVPRYFVPLTVKGQIAIKCGAHRGWTEMIPRNMKPTLKRLQRIWYSRKEDRA